MSTTSAPPSLPSGFPARRGLRDWLYAAVTGAAALAALHQFGHFMDGWDKIILVGAVLTLVWLGWAWRPLQLFCLSAGALSLTALLLYQGAHGGDLAHAQTQFLLKYLLSSQSAILWMCLLYFLSTLFYWLGLLAPNSHNSVAPLGTALAWAASTMALTGSLVRWYESYLIGPGIGHIPVSNLYEVFVLFCWVTTLFNLYYETRYQSRSTSAFVMLIVSAAVGFLLWYSFARQAQVIQPLVPALQSWWMKVHVPANFIGYGTFAIAAMVGFAWLIKHHSGRTRWLWLAPLWLPGLGLCLAPLLMQRGAGSYWLVYAGICLLLICAIVALRRRIAPRLPRLEVLDDLMYRAIAMGFAFFTIATVLGAFWAAQAWGSYWSWDPKETWALIVWLNYAAWLHMRLIKGWRGSVLAWWAIVGLAVTTFAFLGVNMFLSGLHSYGQL